MSMSSSMAASVAGLAAQSTKLATISDNIANSATYGYKRVETDFDALVLIRSGPPGNIRQRRDGLDPACGR